MQAALVVELNIIANNPVGILVTGKFMPTQPLQNSMK